MKQLSISISILLCMSIGFTTTSTADIKKGHKIYKKKLQKSCKLAGSLFARKHTQDEWETIKEEGKFKETIKTICPDFDLNRLTNHQLQDLYDFSYQFGIGGEIPNGCDPK